MATRIRLGVIVYQVYHKSVIQNWKAHLEKKEIWCLRKLLEQPVHEVLSPVLSAGDKASPSTFNTPNVSLCLENGEYVIIGNERSETPLLALDYWIMFVQESQTPNEIRYSTPGLARPRTLSRKLADLDSQVVKIEVYEGYESLSKRAGEETVHYDHALVFTLKNKKRFCISVQATRADQVIFTTDDTWIENLIDGCTLRTTLK